MKYFMKIYIKLESHLNLPCLQELNNNNLNPIKQVLALNLKLKSFSLKKKNKILLTLLSGPHVHKKAREQYKMDYNRRIYLCYIKDIQDKKKFLQFKTKLYDFYMDQGIQITYTYLKTIKILGFLSTKPKITN